MFARRGILLRGKAVAKRRPMRKPTPEEMREKNALRHTQQFMDEVAWGIQTSQDKVPVGKRRRDKQHAVSLGLRGDSLANHVKTMSDSEWEALPLGDKHAFVKLMSQRIKEAPSTVTEQMRRRYYETTMRDPRSENPAETVTDPTERVRLGLPREVLGGRQLGVTPAMYEAADGTMFEPEQAYKIENAMTEVKQLFVDYVRKKREGLSTEAERRKLSQASQALNYETQSHLANMFKHAEAQVQQVIRDERKQQLQHIAAVREAVKRKTKTVRKAPSRKERMKRTLRDTYGVDVDTASAVWKQKQAQEKFLRLCEVMARLTTGGFQHTDKDESLDQYTETLRNVYSANPQQLCRVDAVQYLAATEGVPPIDWATRWFERSLLLPLQQTPEFRAVKELHDEERAIEQQAIKRMRGDTDDAEPSDAAEAAPADEGPEPTHHAEDAMTSVVSLTQKMFVSPDDQRITTMHEKRLRYIAHMHMESQVKRMRANARLFEGAEASEEASRCRELYAEITARRDELRESGVPDGEHFADEAVRERFEEIQSISKAFIAQRVTDAETDRRARKVQQLADAVGVGRVGQLTAEARRARTERKTQQVLRMLRLLEKDVRDDMLWVENAAEAERPPPIPIPEPMSYVSAADVRAWEDLRGQEKANAANPFKRNEHPHDYNATLFGQKFTIPDKPTVFWGTGSKAVEQALQVAAREASRERLGLGLPPPYPCAENPWGWRVREDPLDEPIYDTGRKA